MNEAEESDNLLVSAQQRLFVGIDGFCTTTPPIRGKIKEDIADFIVREITESGEVLSTYEKSTPAVPFQSPRDRYTLFTLIKKNMDTILVAQKIQDYLHLPPHAIKWAGIKDHTAITAQLMSVKGDHVEDLQRINHPNITITNIRPGRTEVDVGKLWGNHFNINVRKTLSPYESLETVLTEWAQQISTTGIPNFFGLQRFGQHRPNSHLVGKAYFLEQYQTACEEFLFKVYPLEYSGIAQFRQLLATQANYAQLIQDIPSGLFYEKILLQQLIEHPGDYKNALDHLPPALLHLVLSSYQSFLFNRVLSLRLKLANPFSKPQPGDVISILKTPAGHPSLVFYHYQGGKGWNDEAIEKAFHHERATIVAPILGYRSKLEDFPFFAPLYRQVLEEEKFDPQSFRLTGAHIPRFEGTFRAISIKPSRLEVSQAYLLNRYPEKDPFGIRLEFSLPKGSYATLVLDELLKNASI